MVGKVRGGWLSPISGHLYARFRNIHQPGCFVGPLIRAKDEPIELLELFELCFFLLDVLF